jgi:D-arabinose 1-dehydrogenase-like Zn-dependent alcohol dehydrogenase
MPSMHAVQVSRPGGSLELVERPVPAPGPGTGRIKVQACGIYHSDLMTTEGHWLQSGVRSMNEAYPLERAAEAYDRMLSGKARFRVVLTTGG